MLRRTRSAPEKRYGREPEWVGCRISGCPRYGQPNIAAHGCRHNRRKRATAQPIRVANVPSMRGSSRFHFKQVCWLDHLRFACGTLPSRSLHCCRRLTSPPRPHRRIPVSSYASRNVHPSVRAFECTTPSVERRSLLHRFGNRREHRRREAMGHCQQNRTRA
jgi:hypothetical protein